ncbi:MAG: hypothetical protein DMG06_27610 [Acidobacteria bacterium]|nr:MAG: hypothetical protein DMG06_27610 [Acidobacteriota bacterium]
MYRPYTLANRSTTESVDNRMIASMRLILALSLLLIIYIDPTQPDRYVPVTDATLFLYVAYSVILYTLTLRRKQFPRLFRAWGHWVDVGWYTLLIALSLGTDSIYLFGFFFPILMASFRWGFMSGLRVAVVSAAIFSIDVLATTPTGPNFEWERSLLRPVYLLLLGYMIAYLGGFEVKLRQRLTLLKEIPSLSNPRFGIDRTIGALMEGLRNFHDADACLLIMAAQGTSGYSLRRAIRRDPEAATTAEPIAMELAQMLLRLPPDYAVVYSSALHWWERLSRAYYGFDVARRKRTPEAQETSEALAVTLDTNSFITVPVRFGSQSVGRLYLTAQRRHAFHDSDIDFLLQVIEHVIPAIDNIRLVDQLASTAAEEERQRIARDIHDSVIQPYIGLQIGLAALRWKFTSGATEMTRDVERLIEMTSLGIDDLRRYVSKLKETGEHEGSLLSAIRRFARKFTEWITIVSLLKTSRAWLRD